MGSGPKEDPYGNEGEETYNKDFSYEMHVDYPSSELKEQALNIQHNQETDTGSNGENAVPRKEENEPVALKNEPVALENEADLEPIDIDCKLSISEDLSVDPSIQSINTASSNTDSSADGFVDLIGHEEAEKLKHDLKRLKEEVSKLEKENRELYEQFEKTEKEVNTLSLMVLSRNTDFSKSYACVCVCVCSGQHASRKVDLFSS